METFPFTKRCFTLIIAFTGVLTIATSQTNFDKGNVLFNSGETIEGYLMDNNSSVYSRFVAFKEQKKAKAVKMLTPKDISQFETYNGTVYEANAVAFQFHSKGGIQHTYAGKRFLKVLKKGKVSIYELRDLDVRAWFFQKDNQPLQFLGMNKKVALPYFEKFVSALADCPQIEWNEDRSERRIGELILAAEEYNQYRLMSDAVLPQSKIGTEYMAEK